MANLAKVEKWLDRQEYPFKSHFLPLKEGKIHYIDEGSGEVILFVHGTPTWSFVYRNYIKQLSKKYRCIAIDHLGFGLSDKPKDFLGTPEQHSENLQHLIDTLQLKDITMVVHDFGGPIGLSCAIAQAQNIKRIVLFNTWLWETKDDQDAQKINKILHSRLGNFIYLYTNFSPKVLLKKAFYNAKLLSKKIHRHYCKPFPNKNSRYGLLKIGKSLIGSSDWYQKQWEKMDLIADKPVLVLWGLKDDFIKENNLDKWAGKLKNKTIHTFEAGHFVQEEKLEESMDCLKKWLANTNRSD